MLNVVQTWSDRRLPRQLRRLAQRVSSTPGVRYLFFDDHDADLFFASCAPEVQECRKGLTKIEALDLFRYLVIERFGGLYLDLDVELTAVGIPGVTHGMQNVRSVEGTH